MLSDAATSERRAAQAMYNLGLGLPLQSGLIVACGGFCIARLGRTKMCQFPSG